MDEQYIRAEAMLTADERERLHKSRACVAGCGGLGGYLVELLARAGVGCIRIADGDVFEQSNLDRQLLCQEALIGRNKAEAAADRIAAINSSVRAEVRAEYLTQENALSIVTGCDIALDGLDSAAARLLLAKACAAAGIPMVHGAISGWRAQVAFLPPGSWLLELIYPPGAEPESGGTLSCVPAYAASIQAAEAIKWLTGREPSLSGRLLLTDLLTQQSQTIALG